jgi:hypothetical protein
MATAFRIKDFQLARAPCGDPGRKKITLSGDSIFLYHKKNNPPRKNTIFFSV